MIDRSTIDNLALLARLGISDDEKDALLTDVTNILAYVDRIQDVQMSPLADRSYPQKNVYREDESIVYTPGQFTERLLALAPSREGDFVRVQKILNRKSA